MQRDQDAGLSRGCQSGPRLLPVLTPAAPPCHRQCRQGRLGSVITAVTRGLKHGHRRGLQVESEQFAALAPSSDLGEGINAWIERRQPLYRGRWRRPDILLQVSFGLSGVFGRNHRPQVVYQFAVMKGEAQVQLALGPIRRQLANQIAFGSESFKPLQLGFKVGHDIPLTATEEIRLRLRIASPLTSLSNRTNLQPRR
ncbi:hypothetical protein IVB30_07865 [Bradyrhizobium sp. 200]|uniref:hypothetical protein n=1 Tax=Bradyrhizobium sp. 200 TaxID=2782665 RepID=UPI001FFF2AC8|nr:hypothetical protein [Bradyrhizobium sp. 200]UPJ51255.1 hypothetical protein IVB30_07865 [Bradyrhizobium sp. 200]